MAKKDKVELDGLKGRLEQIFGKGSIVKANTDSFVKVREVTPTGSLTLDLATKIGGVPKGGLLTHILGKESSGKCMDKNAYILTAQGYKTVEEIFNENEVPLFIDTKEIPKEVELINCNKEIEKTTHFTQNGRRKTWKVKTRSGFEFIRTYKHPLLTISESGNLIWKWAGELQKGDYIVKKQKEVFGTKSIEGRKAYSLGALVADGTFNKNRVGFTNNDPCVLEYITDIAELVGVDAKVYPRPCNNTTEYHFNSKVGLNDICDFYGFKKGVAKNKHIPQYIRECNKETLIEFIKGYMDSESYIDKKGIEVSSASKELLYQLKLILTQFCINSFLSEKKVKGYEHNKYYVLNIYASDAKVFIEKIGTNSKKVEDKYNNFIIDRIKIRETSNYKGIPNTEHIVRDIQRQDTRRLEAITYIIEDLKTGNLTSTKLKKLNTLVKEKSKLLDHLNLLAEYEYEEVESCEYYDNIPTFDFAMSQTHTFEADGFINHNTSLSLHIIAEEQKKGNPCAFLDIEGTFDPIYAASIGVNLDLLYLIDQDSLLKSLKIKDRNTVSGQEWLDVVIKLLQMDEFGIIVLDSVATLTPLQEIQNGVAGGGQIARMGSMLSSAMRNINANLTRCNSGLIFLNQYRISPGNYGNPFVEVGGEAIKYYTALKIELTKSVDKDKDSKEVFGLKVKANITKSKVGIPYGSAEYYIDFGKGIVRWKEVMDIAVDKEIITKEGNTYSFEGNKLGVGLGQLEECLQDNPELLEKLEIKVLDLLNNKIEVKDESEVQEIIEISEDTPI